MTTESSTNESNNSNYKSYSLNGVLNLEDLDLVTDEFTITKNIDDGENIVSTCEISEPNGKDPIVTKRRRLEKIVNEGLDASIRKRGRPELYDPSYNTTYIYYNPGANPKLRKKSQPNINNNSNNKSKADYDTTVVHVDINEKDIANTESYHYQLEGQDAINVIIESVPSNNNELLAESKITKITNSECADRMFMQVLKNNYFRDTILAFLNVLRNFPFESMIIDELAAFSSYVQERQNSYGEDLLKDLIRFDVDNNFDIDIIISMLVAKCWHYIPDIDMNRVAHSLDNLLMKQTCNSSLAAKLRGSIIHEMNSKWHQPIYQTFTTMQLQQLTEQINQCCILHANTECQVKTEDESEAMKYFCKDTQS